MRGLLVISVLVSMVGCGIPRTEFRVPPAPTAHDVAQARGAQIRVVPIPIAEFFPKVLEILMDQGYQVRSANARLGLVAFYRQWSDKDYKGAPSFSQEGTILVQAAGAGATRVRLAMSGRSEENFGGDAVFLAGVQQSATAEDYKQLLDRLEQGLTGGSKVGDDRP